MFKNNKKYFLIFGGLILLPVILDLYNQNFGLTKEYDWLSFYGNLVGSFVTIIGIKLTLDFESEQSRRDEKISYRPILRFSSKNLDNKGDFSKSQIILRDETSLKKFQENNISNSKAGKDKLSGEIESLLSQSLKYVYVQSRFLLCISNVSSNNAILSNIIVLDDVIAGNLNYENFYKSCLVKKESYLELDISLACALSKEEIDFIEQGIPKILSIRIEFFDLLKNKYCYAFALQIERVYQEDVSHHYANIKIDENTIQVEPFEL
ncbi:hypothetical protein HMPREF9965_0356 [Streptococcus mitis bv. 2 str. SK95]|uniref:Uncharacterized protein n=1 Tax=Streptococcus mitis bv. 2 str. SK95 TaxID=1000588 RepID=F9LYS2_STROR|nr:hypothetical protein [Streptococcus mitis]EGU63947.1 hypothetical protein HMPREF9965_0356 [Streptococcus mitis bv. 2 str. SK95]